MSNAKKNDLVLRDMAARDLDTVVTMEKEIFPDPWPRSAFEEQIGGDGWGALVVEIDGAVVGYACYFTVDVEAHLTNIAVRPEHRRKSVANMLLGAILGRATAAGCQYLLLEVRSSNNVARTFYERKGFRILYRRPNYYRRPIEDALVMVFYLDGRQGG
ncbi:MAG TPA: ribosomal protein S18-alanine N-acetyltransferase [candidate division Zixibacteria bacterium]|nr:ribosomal protein S18-alanine N-acetyltransferase [candidate division Zixibacteria bacterium]